MTEIKHMFTLVRVGLAASVSVVAAYYTFQRLRNKSDTEPGRSLGNQFQNAEVKSTDELQAQSYNKLCSVKKNYNSKSLSGNLFLPHAIGNRLPLVKRVDNAKLVVQKLKTIKEEDENPSSENPTQTAEITNIKLAEVHTRSSRVAKLPPKPSPSSNGPPVKGPPPSGKPTPPHPHPPPGALGVPPPPPPPPPPRGMLTIQGTTSEKLQRAPELVKFYHFLMNRKAKKEATTPTSAAAQSNIIAEIKNRSSFFLLVKADVETQGDFIQSLATEVRAAAYTNVEDIVSFMNWLDEELANLVDERAVLKHFDWPESKADALREAAFEYLDLKKLETEITSFVDDRKLSSDAALKKMYSLLEKVEKIVYALLRRRDMTIARYKEFGIPCDWLLDSGLVGKIKLASVKLARDYMKRVASELDNTMNVREKEPMREFILLQCVRFAFKVYQFAGGLDAESMRAFEELRGHAHGQAERTDSLSSIN